MSGALAYLAETPAEPAALPLRRDWSGDLVSIQLHRCTRQGCVNLVRASAPCPCIPCVDAALVAL